MGLFDELRKPAIHTMYALVASCIGDAVAFHCSDDSLNELIADLTTRDPVELGMGNPPDGLSVWSGHWIGGGKRGPEGDYDDPVLFGEYRSLTDDEWVRFRAGSALWSLPHEGYEAGER